MDYKYFIRNSSEKKSVVKMLNILPYKQHLNPFESILNDYIAV